MGDGQHGAAATPANPDVNDWQQGHWSEIVAQEESEWKKKVAHLDELLRKAGVQSEAMFIECVRAVFRAGASE